MISNLNSGYSALRLAGVVTACLLLAADMMARVVVAPAELPIGTVTALVGGPVFLWILLRKRGLVEV